MEHVFCEVIKDGKKYQHLLSFFDIEIESVSEKKGKVCATIEQSMKIIDNESGELESFETLSSEFYFPLGEILLSDLNAIDRRLDRIVKDIRLIHGKINYDTCKMKDMAIYIKLYKK